MERFLWQKDSSLLGLQDRKIKLLSCDIFDTLVFRTTLTPQDLFIYVGREAREKKLIIDGIEPEEFKQLRILAERKARQKKQQKNGTNEVNIYEIYDQIPLEIADKDKLLNLELEIEKKCLYLNSSIASLLQYYYEKGIPIVLLSDMYLPSNQLKDLLSFIGFDCSIVDEIIVSNEYGCSKWDKGLYHVLLNKYSHIKPEEIAHIGDTYFSDVENARSCGILSFYYRTREDKGTIYELERIKHGAIVPEILSLRKMAGNLSGEYSREKRFWFEFGATILGPLLSVFTEWVVDTAIDKGIKKIYPLMREGGIITKLVNNSLIAREITDIEVKPLYISRRSSYLPSLPSVNKKVIMDSILNQPWATVDAIFTKLKIENRFSEYRNVRISEASNIFLDSGKKLIDEILDYLCSEENIQKLRNMADMESSLLIEYLTTEYEVANQPFMTVDIGYSGSMQSALDSILKKAGYQCKSIHLVVISYINALNKILEGTDIRGFISEAVLDKSIITNNWTPGIIEVLMMEGIGSTLGYKKLDSGKVVPVLEHIEVEKLNLEEKAICQEGILTFQYLFINLLKQKPWLKKEILNQRRQLYWIISRFMEFPTYSEAKHLGDLYHENLFEEGDKLEKFCPDNLSKAVREKGPTSFLGTKRDNSNIWMAGVVERTLPNYFRLKLLRQIDNNGTLQSVVKLASIIHQKNINELIVYGAGQMGRELVSLLKQIGVKINCIVDKNRNLWGNLIEGVRVCSLDDALQSLNGTSQSNNTTVVIASVSFMKEIRDNLEQKSKKMGLKLDILDYSMS